MGIIRLIFLILTQFVSLPSNEVAALKTEAQDWYDGIDNSHKAWKLKELNMFWGFRVFLALFSIWLIPTIARWQSDLLNPRPLEDDEEDDEYFD